MKIVFDGREYEGIEAMPPDVRLRYKATLKLAQWAGQYVAAHAAQDGEDGADADAPVGSEPAAGGGAGPDSPAINVTVKVKQRIVFNGVTYESLDQMPAEVRAAFERAALAGGAAAVARAAQSKPGARKPVPLAVLLPFAAFAAAAILYVGEFRALQRTFDDGRLYFWGAGLGVVGAAFVVRPLWSAFGESAVQRWVFTAVMAFVLTGAGTALASIVNRGLGGGTPETWSFTVADKRHVPKRGKSAEFWDVVVSARGRELRFRLSPEAWSRLEVGGSYSWQVRQGLLGYPFLMDPALR